MDAYNYDSMGRVNGYYQDTPYNSSGPAWQTSYNYDLAGDVTSWTHPAGFTIMNTINTAQQITQIQSSLMDSTHPQYLAKNITYTPWGAEQTLENGCASSAGQETGCTDTLETYVYNNRMQPVIIELGNTSNASADYRLVCNYYPNVGNPTSCATPAQGGYNGGDVMGIFDQDNVNTSLSHTEVYAYDALNRLSTAVATGNSTYNLAFTYDRSGNVTCQVNGQTQGLCPAYSFSSANNRITNSGFAYDAAGDLMSDGTHTYQWNAEGMLVSTDNGSTEQNSYNALGEWAEDYYPGAADRAEELHNPAGLTLGIYSSMRSSWWQQYIPLWGRNEAYYNFGGTTRFTHPDRLTSTVASTSGGGTELTAIREYPFGEDWLTVGDTNLDEFFAGFQRHIDQFNETYQSQTRRYEPGLGRWLTPDPLGGDITNPQSLNRYAYALNNPTTLTDPTGLWPQCQGCKVYDPSTCGDFACSAPGPGGGGNWGSCELNGSAAPCGIVSSVLSAGAGCVGSCTSSVLGSNGKAYTVVQTAGSPDIYAPNGELLYPDGESVAEVGLQNAERGIYSVFAAMCINQGCNPFAPQQVGYQFAKGVYNVTWGGHTLNTSNLAGYWKDPISFMHNGNPSWYEGSPLDMFNVVHLIGGATLEGHEDPFGALNPLHYLIQFPQMLVPAGGRYNATCSLAGGCVIGR